VVAKYLTESAETGCSNMTVSGFDDKKPTGRAMLQRTAKRVIAGLRCP
jgi:hypothetical protein